MRYITKEYEIETFNTLVNCFDTKANKCPLWYWPGTNKYNVTLVLYTSLSLALSPFHSLVRSVHFDDLMKGVTIVDATYD